MPHDSETSARERRRYQRYAVRCKCWLEGDHATLGASTADIGLGGLFLRTAIPVEHGTVVDVALDLADGQAPVIADGVVTRAVGRREQGRLGVGVEFVRIRDGRQTLINFLGAQA